MFSILSDRMARSYAYAKVVKEFGDVLKWYPNWYFCSHWNRGSKKWINMYGLKVSPWIVS